MQQENLPKSEKIVYIQQQQILKKILEKLPQENPITNLLDELYQSNDFGYPKYYVIKHDEKTSPWTIGIRCPEVIDCDGRTTIGVGIDLSELKATVLAAEEALDTLRFLGYSYN